MGSSLSDRHYHPQYTSLPLTCDSLALERLITASEYYFTFWMYYDKLTPVYSGNFKPWDMYGSNSNGVTPSTYAGMGDPLQVVNGTPAPDGGLRSASQDNPPTYQDTIWASRGINDFLGKWVRIEGYLKQSSPGAADGVYQMWLHTGASGEITSPVMSDASFISRTTTDYWRQLLIGWYNDENRNGQGDHAARIYYDDIYLDTTRARVEICDAATRAAATRCEIQIPSAWSGSDITVQVNQGAFLSGAVAYLYVIDAQGNSNANGLQITFASGGDNVAPASPANLRAFQ